MADVYVESWGEFVAAVGVAGDTVILPEEAEWDMNEILPYGLQSDIAFACKKIDGRGTRIKNLNLNSYKFQYSETDIKIIHNLLMTDWIGTAQWFDLRYGSELFKCAFSGITSASNIIYNENTYFYSTCKMISCSINVESSARNFNLCFSVNDLKYCRVEIHAPNSTAVNCVGDSLFCEIILYIPNAAGTLYAHEYNGCTLRGDLHGITSAYQPWSGWTGHPTVYHEETLSPDFVNPFPTYFIECAEDQMKDAAYLRSLGFPIVVG